MPDAANDDGPKGSAPHPKAVVIRNVGPLEALAIYARSLNRADAAPPAANEPGPER